MCLKQTDAFHVNNRVKHLYRKSPFIIINELIILITMKTLLFHSDSSLFQAHWTFNSSLDVVEVLTQFVCCSCLSACFLFISLFSWCLNMWLCTDTTKQAGIIQTSLSDTRQHETSLHFGFLDIITHCFTVSQPVCLHIHIIDHNMIIHLNVRAATVSRLINYF